MANFQSTKTGQFIEDILNQFLTQQGDNSTPIYLTEGGSVHPGTLIPVTTLPSYVGMIIHSTTLADEGAVKAIYGGEAWIMHSGYFLYGAGGSTPNRNMADGGSADAIVVQHTHGYSGITGNNNVNHTHSFTTGNQSANHTHTFSGTTNATGVDGRNANMPPFKNVFIWERIA